MNMPGLTAEHSLYKASGYYMTGEHTSLFTNTIRPALQNTGNGLTCSGNCPEGSSILCQGDNGSNCICCTWGCNQTPAGTAICADKPKTGIIGRGGALHGAPGGVLM